MTLLERIEAAKKLWSLLCPKINLPSDTWVALWCTTYPDSIIEQGIARVAQKFEGGVDATSSPHKYATAVFRHIQSRQREVTK